MIIEFFVPGKSVPSGSKRGFVYPKAGTKTGYAAALTDANPNAPVWRQAIVAAAREVYKGELLRGPICLTLSFYMPRPKAHYRTGKNAGVLRDDAPKWHITKPDRTKLTRGVEDALSAVIWQDDNQVCTGPIEKLYGPNPGVSVKIDTMEGW